MGRRRPLVLMSKVNGTEGKVATDVVVSRTVAGGGDYIDRGISESGNKRWRCFVTAVLNSKYFVFV